jgi:hypothetical protein
VRIAEICPGSPLGVRSRATYTRDAVVLGEKAYVNDCGLMFRPMNIKERQT